MFNEPLTMDEIFEQNANYLFNYYSKIKKEDDEKGAIIIPGFLMIKNICNKSNNTENVIDESNLPISSEEENEKNQKKKKNFKNEDEENFSEKDNKKTKPTPRKKRRYFAIKTCQIYDIKTEF